MMTLNVGEQVHVSDMRALGVVADKMWKGEYIAFAKVCELPKSALLIRPNTAEWGYGDRFWLVGMDGEILLEVRNRIRSCSVLEAVIATGAARVHAIIRHNAGNDDVGPSLTVYINPKGTIAEFAATVDPKKDEAECVLLE